MPFSPLDDIPKVIRAGPARWADILRAIAGLARANRHLGKAEARDLPLTASGDESGTRPLTSAQQQLVDRVTYVIPRVGRRLPWRSDCLIQALAARRWLAGHGIPTTLHLGTRTSADKGFEAHAWLTAGSQVVTGWDIEGFAEFMPFPAPARDASSGD